MATNATPEYLPNVLKALAAINPVKPATPDLIVFNDDNVPVDMMTDLIFEDIGGQEILGLSRNDIVNGQKVIYTPIANTASIGFKYSPYNIFTVPSTSDSYFQNFSIKLDSVTPDFGEGTGHLIDPTGTNPELVGLRETVYVEYATDDEPNFPTSDDLIVNVKNMSSNDVVEIEVLSSGYPSGDIIY